MRRPRRRRPAFTLLEVIMATTIAVLILGALYVAVDLLLRSAQISRDTIQDSTLERALMGRMDADAAQVIGLSDPARYRFQSGQEQVQAAAASTPGGANAANSANSAASASNTSATNTTSAGSNTTSGASSFGSGSSTTSSSGVSNVVLPLGVMGDSQTLHLFISNLPREIYSSSAAFNSADPANMPPVGDVRRVSYWLVGGDAPLGLARQEVPIATSDDALQNLPPDVDNEESFIIADEVRSLQFQYWDGTEWMDNWDSTELGPDGVTPIGSPLAIAVTVGIVPKQSGPPQGDVPLRTFRHVLVIPSANGMTLQTEAASGTSTAQTTPSTTTNANSTTMGGGASP